MSGPQVNNTQQLAVAASMTAAENLDKLVQAELRQDQKVEQNKKSEESILQQVLNGKSKDAGVQILARLADKLAQNLPTGKILNSIKKDYDFLFEGREEAPTDIAQIQNSTDPISAIKKQKGLKGEAEGFASGQEAETTPQETIKEYVGAYSQFLLGGGAEAKKKLDEIEIQLAKKSGLETKDVQSLKVQVASTMRREIVQQIKHSYLKQLLSQEKSMEGLVASQEVKKFINAVFFNDKLGGYDFGGYDQHLQGAVDRARDEVHDEVKEFIKDELTGKLLNALNDRTKKTEKEIEELVKVGTKIGVDFMAVVKNTQRLKEDLGFNPVIAMEASLPDGNMQDSRERHHYQYTQEEEKEILTDKLRALYLRRALHGDMRSVLETQFKMIKLKNGLIKLGVINFEQIEKEGRALARGKLMEMLREAFEERATYAQLSGEAWRMTEKKIKTVLRNLEKLGVTLSQTELDLIRDKANAKMKTEAEHELSLLNAALELRGEMKYLLSKKKMILQVLDRLAAESRFLKPGEELCLNEAV